LADVSDFSFSDNQFQNFMNHVSTSDFSFETKAEKAIKDALSNDEDFVFDQTVETDFQKLLVDIEKSKISALKTHQKEIQNKIEDEIS